MIPKGFEQFLIDGAYFNPTTREIVITGPPAEDDETHSCDAMGCSSVGHVIFRGMVESFSYCPLAKKVDPPFYWLNDDRVVTTE